MQQTPKEENLPELPHKITLDGRERLSVAGVSEVESFDETMIALGTARGVLVVRGMGLKLKKLAPEGGQVAVEGKIDSMVYEEEKAASGFWSRLWG